MKTSIALGLTLAASVAGVTLPTSNAWAVATILNGSACHHYNPGEAQFPNYFVDGANNSNTSARTLICPLAVTHTAGQTTGSVYVDTNGVGGFTCALYSYSDTDVFLGSKSVAIAAGARSTFLSSVPVSTFSNHSVVCFSVPGSGAAKIVAIEANF